jgi:hypothetical protein
MPHISTFTRISPLEYKGEKHLALKFPSDEALNVEVKQRHCACRELRGELLHISEFDGDIEVNCFSEN